TKQPNFGRILHSGTFPLKRPNQSSRMSAEFRTRDVSAETAKSIPPNFCRISHSGTFPTKLSPNFALEDVSNERTNFCRISHLATFPPKRPNFLPISHSGTFPTKLPNFRPISHSWTFLTKQPNQSRPISAEFHTRGRFRRNGSQH
ncbi:MAG: hypothetical protein Q8881_04455, partial [Sweet potato little leaf phytoplasma]|nr:hypothetical protein [Sweet potato little leaf phytoplasma]